MYAPSPPSSLLAVAIIVWFVVFGRLIWLRHARFATFDFDLGHHDQAIWLLAHGKGFITVSGMPVLGHHLTLAYFAVAPLYWLGGGPQLLDLLQTAALALSAVPLFLYARDRLGNEWLALTFGVAWLLNPTVQWLCWEAWHPETMAIPFLLMTWLMASRRRHGWYWVFLIAALTWKEDIALAVIGLGIVLLVRKQRRLGVLTIAVGVGLVPRRLRHRHAGVQRRDEPRRDLLRRARRLAGRPDQDDVHRPDDGARPAATTTTPSATPATCSPRSPSRRCSPRCCWCRRSPSSSPTSSPTSTSSGASSSTTRRSSSRSWPSPASTASPASRRCRCAASPSAPSPLPPWRRRWPGACRRSARSTATATGRSTATPARPSSTRRSTPFPADAAVAATYNIVPHLSHREQIYTFPNPWFPLNWGVAGVAPHDPDHDHVPAEVDWIVVDRTTHVPDGREEQLIDSLLDSGEFEVVSDEAGILVASDAPSRRRRIGEVAPSCIDGAQARLTGASGLTPGQFGGSGSPSGPGFTRRATMTLSSSKITSNSPSSAISESMNADSSG